MEFTHKDCGEIVEVEERQIVSQPNESVWPKDAKVNVGYCRACRSVVGVDALVPSFRQERRTLVGDGDGRR